MGERPGKYITSILWRLILSLVGLKAEMYCSLEGKEPVGGVNS